MSNAREIWNVIYMDGTYGEAIAADAMEAEDILCRSDVEMSRGAIRFAAPDDVTVSISNFSSERN